MGAWTCTSASADRYAGATNVLCLYNAATGVRRRHGDERSTGADQRDERRRRRDPIDGDLDIVVANRCRMNGTCGASFDYYLINNGSGVFTLTYLNQFATDSRSVASAASTRSARPRSDRQRGRGRVREQPRHLGTAAHRMQIFVNQSVPPALSHRDKAIPDYFGTAGGQVHASVHAQSSARRHTATTR
jgi:hypothetical protein